MPLTQAETRALDALDEEEVVTTLVHLVRVPSVRGTDAESELQHLQASLFETEGLAVDVWQLDLEALRRDPRFPGTEADRIEGYGLVGTTGGDGSPGVILQGHVDVVPIGDRAKWEHDPFAGRVEAGRLHGRGGCDMKARPRSCRPPGGPDASLIPVAYRTVSLGRTAPRPQPPTVACVGLVRTPVRKHSCPCLRQLCSTPSALEVPGQCRPSHRRATHD